MPYIGGYRKQQNHRNWLQIVHERKKVKVYIISKNFNTYHYSNYLIIRKGASFHTKPKYFLLCSKILNFGNIFLLDDLS